MNSKKTEKSVVTDEQVAELKKNHEPELIDALLHHAEDIDLDTVLKASVSILANQAPGSSAFDKIALERRQQEVELIKHEVRIFEEMSNLMTQVTDRYAALTGVPRAYHKQKEGE